MKFVTNPQEIESRSFKQISDILGDRRLDCANENVIKRVIHTTADFEYADNLVFSDGAVAVAKETLKSGARIITDTQMARAGINKRALEKLNCTVHCFIDAPEVADIAKKRGITRSAVAVEHAVETLDSPYVFVVGNAPTALIKLHEFITKGILKPALVIGVPVGFVNVVESKELIMGLAVPHIVARGRKGGSNVAAAIINAITYELGAC